MTSGHFLFRPQLFERLGLYSSKYEIETNFPPRAGRGSLAPIGARCFRATARQTKSTISNGPSPAVGESHRRRAREVESSASKGHGGSRRPRCAGEAETGAPGIPRSDAACTLEGRPNDPAHSGKNARRSTGPGLSGICLGERRLPACSCRQHSRCALICARTKSNQRLGKLPRRAGWQPAFPRNLATRVV